MWLGTWRGVNFFVSFISLILFNIPYLTMTSFLWFNNFVDKFENLWHVFTFKSISQQLLYLDLAYLVCSYIFVSTCLSATCICYMTLNSFSWLSDCKFFTLKSISQLSYNVSSLFIFSLQLDLGAYLSVFYMPFDHDFIFMDEWLY